MIIETKYGRVKGFKQDGYYQFKGIIYATAKRFEACVPYYFDELDCTQLRSRCPQYHHEVLEGCEDDCLNLNIYTPSLDKKLPVLVYIYGGAFQTGGNDGLDPCKVIRNDEFILVCINYRVGTLGFLYQEEYPTSGSNGTLDQVTALKWIYENIEAFGGDQNRITLIGDSAGAKSIGALNALQLPYYSQVIMVSGAYQAVRDQTSALWLTNQFKQKATQDLVSMPVQDLLDLQQSIIGGKSNTCMFGPVKDGVVIPYEYDSIVHDERYFKGNSLITCNLHELDFYRLFVKNLEEIYPTITHELFGDQDRYANEAIERLGATKENICTVLTNYMYRLYSYRLANRQLERGLVSYLASFEFEAAMHCFDFNLALKQNYDQYQDQATAKVLSEEIRKCFVEFIQTGKLSNYQMDQLIVFDRAISQKTRDEFHGDPFPEQVYQIVQ